MTSKTLEEYFLALERLKQGAPQRVKINTKITNDAVSLEAGRKKGSIKKGREQFTELIHQIDAAAAEQFNGKEKQTLRLGQMKQTTNSLRIELDSALARELSLLKELYETKKKLSALTGEKVLPLRPKNRD